MSSPAIVKDAERRDSSLSDTSAEEDFASYIDKQNKHGIWQQRYFIITGHYLSYYPNDRRNEKEGGSLDLRNCHLVMREKKTVKLHHNNGQKYKLRFEGEEKAARWKEKLYRTTIDYVPESPKPSITRLPMTPTVAISPMSKNKQIIQSNETSLCGRHGRVNELDRNVDFYIDTEAESIVGGIIVRIYFFAAMCSVFIAATATVPVPTLGFWFFKVDFRFFLS